MRESRAGPGRAGALREMTSPSLGSLGLCPSLLCCPPNTHTLGIPGRGSYSPGNWEDTVETYR
jgi:hypothetical protein